MHYIVDRECCMMLAANCSLTCALLKVCFSPAAGSGRTPPDADRVACSTSSRCSYAASSCSRARSGGTLPS